MQKNLKQIAAAVAGKTPTAKNPADNVQPMPNQEMIQIDPQLAAQIKALGGNVDELQIALGNMAQANAAPAANVAVGLDATGKVANPRKVEQQGSSPMHQVSGDEFLSTLGALQASQGGAKNSFAQNGQEGFSQQNGQNGEQLAFGQKPNLRVIEGGLKNKRPQFEDSLVSSKGALGASAGASYASQTAEVKAPPTEVAGHVVKGAMSQDRLSSESILGVSSGIKTLSQNGGGEMKIRLKPDNLGELHLRVVTDGTQVGLHIQASDDKAKKILEESVGHLKEGLASQNLSLGKLDVTVAQAVRNGDAQMRQDSNPQNPGQNSGQAWSSDWAGQNQSQGQGQSGRESSEGRSGHFLSGDDAASKASVALARNQMGRNSAAAAASGRLDVRA